MKTSIEDSFNRVKDVVNHIRKLRSSGVVIESCLLKAKDHEAFMIYSMWSEQIKTLAKLKQLEITLK